MSKLTNLFEDFRDYQSRKVDNPNYTPLGQTILKPELSKEELNKQKAREYSKKYYEDHKEERKEYYRNYHKRTGQLKKEYGLKWMQLRIYKYLLEYHNRWHDLPRWTKIARDLNLNLQSVYNTMFCLIKKWYASRWALGKYYLINPPIKEEDEIKKELEVMWETFDEPEMVYVEENKYDEMENKIKSLEEQVSNSVSHIDWLMNSNSELEKKNIDLLHQIEELKLLIKLLYKYFGNV